MIFDIKAFDACFSDRLIKIISEMVLKFHEDSQVHSVLMRHASLPQTDVTVYAHQPNFLDRLRMLVSLPAGYV